MTPAISCRFKLGQLVQHCNLGFRGVVFDVDESCQADEDWCQHHQQNEVSKDQPWYHILIDGESHPTYVAEENLQSDGCSEPIEHPMLNNFFTDFTQGQYQLNFDA